LLSKRRIKFNLTHEHKQNYSKYKQVIYFLKKNNKIIVDDFIHKQVSLLNSWELKKYISIPDVSTNWFEDINKNYYRVNNNRLIHCICLNDKVKFINIKILINGKFINEIDNITLNNFKIYNKKEFQYVIKCKVPFFPMWVNINNKIVNKLCFKINNKFYKFPYGNVQSQNNSVCFGLKNKSQFNSSEEIYMNIITTQFNNDYDFQLQYTDTTSIKNLTFDLEEINKKIKQKKVDLISILYYLSQHSDNEKIKDLSIDNIFLKTLKTPWGEIN